MNSSVKSQSTVKNEDFSSFAFVTKFVCPSLLTKPCTNPVLLSVCEKLFNLNKEKLIMNKEYVFVFQLLKFVDLVFVSNDFLSPHLYFF